MAPWMGALEDNLDVPNGTQPGRRRLGPAATAT